MFCNFIVVECVDVTCLHDQADLERDFNPTESFTDLNKGFNSFKKNRCHKPFILFFRCES